MEKNKGYYIALEEAKGHKEKIHFNYGWYCEGGLEIEYDDNGRPLI